MTQYSALAGGPEVVLAVGLRSAWVRAGGAFRRENAAHLGAHLAREILAQTGLPAHQLSEVIAGAVGPPHDQANVARVLALRAGVPPEIPARTVGRNCASGIESVTSAVTDIAAGLGDTYLCVGVEVMSAAPLLFGRSMTDLFERLMRARTPAAKLRALAGFRPSYLAPRVVIVEGLRDPISGLLMGQTAELLARDFGITREECDAFALESHRRALAARRSGRFEREILPHLPLECGPGGRSVDEDDAIREDQSLERLGKLRPYFEKPDGVVTVGNACGITDGAGALLVTTRERCRELGLQPLAKIRSWAWAGLDPARMGLGPVFATHLALDAAGCELKDVGAIEINEAFAAQVLACARAFESESFCAKHLGRDRPLGSLDPERTNKNGGAIALGHPVGATGSRLLLSAAHELSASDSELALATLCIGGGQGGAVVLERIAA